VELGEIEHHARELSGAQQLAVIATQTEGGGWTLHLFLEAYTGDTTELRKALQKQLPAYMVPRDLHVLPALPLNSNGKIDRPALKARLG
jgi:acyl-coenzyme A synthetase/AMP-(fatty) acid ligase